MTILFKSDIWKQWFINQLYCPSTSFNSLFSLIFIPPCGCRRRTMRTCTCPSSGCGIEPASCRTRFPSSRGRAQETWAISRAWRSSERLRTSWVSWWRLGTAGDSSYSALTKELQEKHGGTELIKCWTFNWTFNWTITWQTIIKKIIVLVSCTLIYTIFICTLLFFINHFIYIMSASIKTARHKFPEP